MNARDGFRRGNPTFNCSHCGRLTRKTNNTAGSCCPECDEAAMIENGISDNDLQGEELAREEARIAELHRKAVKKGGAIAGVMA
jgi:hypothetical protein